jgi:hypothetical protein
VPVAYVAAALAGRELADLGVIEDRLMNRMGASP